MGKCAIRGSFRELDPRNVCYPKRLSQRSDVVCLLEWNWKFSTFIDKHCNRLHDDQFVVRKEIILPLVLLVILTIDRYCTNCSSSCWDLKLFNIVIHGTKADAIHITVNLVFVAGFT